MSTRDEVLARVRRAVAAGSTSAVEVPRAYGRSGRPAGSGEVVDLLVDRLVDYKAEVVRVDRAGLAAAVGEALAGARAVVVPAGLPADVSTAVEQVPRVVVDGSPEPLGALDLDEIDAVVTTAAVAVAVNGMIVLDAGPGQGRRIISLIPDTHVVVLRADQIVDTVPEAIARLDPARPTTMIAGPSATSDIELSRVEGVHGPRTLRVVIIE